MQPSPEAVRSVWAALTRRPDENLTMLALRTNQPLASVLCAVAQLDELGYYAAHTREVLVQLVTESVRPACPLVESHLGTFPDS